MDEKEDLPNKLSATEHGSPTGAVDGSKYKMARTGNWRFEFNQPAGVLVTNLVYPIEYHFSATANGYVTVVDRFNKDDPKTVVLNSQGIVPLIPILVDKDTTKGILRVAELRDKAKTEKLSWEEQNELLKLIGYLK